MSDAAIQQPSPTKRGRGRGRGGSTRGAASARARGKPAAGRRGRAKVYENSRVQAAHERQRDIKNNFNILAAALKPALETLADRNLQLLSDNHDAHKEVAQYQEIQDFLQDRLEDRQRVDKAILDTQIDVASKSHEASMHIARQNFTVRLIGPLPASAACCCLLLPLLLPTLTWSFFPALPDASRGPR